MNQEKPGWVQARANYIIDETHVGDTVIQESHFLIIILIFKITWLFLRCIEHPMDTKKWTKMLHILYA